MRPVATGHHPFEWLCVTAFVPPATGESFWYLATGVDKGLFEDTLALASDRDLIRGQAGLHWWPDRVTAK